MRCITHEFRVEIATVDGVNFFDVSSCLRGYGASVCLTQNMACFLARREDDRVIRLLFVPNELWRQDIEADGFTIIGNLGEIVKGLEQKENK